MTPLSPEYDVAAARARCLAFRKRILEMSQKVTALHIASAYSCLEIVDTIYFGLMQGRPRGAGTFLMSKGHGCLAQYVILEALGVLSRDDIEQYCQPGGRLGSHPDYGTPGIEASTGSLGHGLGMAMGMALADSITGVDQGPIYVVLSDGELQEGSVWEAMLLAPTLKLRNVIAFVDLNDFQSLGQTSKIHPNFYPVVDKVRAFGWEAREIDGHDSRAVFEAVTTRAGNAPLMVVAKTVKGKGVSYMENVPIWHYRSPSPEEYRQAMDELSRSAV